VVASGGGEADSTGVYPVEHHRSGFLVVCAVHANGAHCMESHVKNPQLWRSRAILLHCTPMANNVSAAAQFGQCHRSSSSRQATASPPPAHCGLNLSLGLFGVSFSLPTYARSSTTRRFLSLQLQSSFAELSWSSACIHCNARAAAALMRFKPPLHVRPADEQTGGSFGLSLSPATY
jgi:hypothetical protein